MPGFSENEIAYFIAFVGILSCIAQVNNECLSYCSFNEY